MAKELAAIAIFPRGATIAVLATLAPLITRLCKAIGRLMLAAPLRHFRVGTKLPRSWLILSSFDRKNT